VSNNVVQFLVSVVQLYSLVVLVRVILTWLPNVSRSNSIVEFIYQITEPVLKPVREALPAMGSFDFSPIVVLIGLRILTVMLERMGGGM
jgi:YggT family protein